MKVNLLELPALYIALDSEKKFIADIEQHLSELGFKNFKRFVAIKDDNSRIGCALSHLTALDLNKPPFIIFEGDAQPLNFFPEIDIPDDADCLLLGYNEYTPKNWGSDTPATEPTSPKVYEKLDGYEDLYKAKGLMATHAMVYFTQEHVDQVKEQIKRALPTGLAHDMFTSQLQPAANVYAVGAPMFSQQGRFYYMTRRRIDVRAPKE
jgi:hypothetical protein